MALPSPSCQPAYPHQQGPLIPSSVFSSDKDLQDMVNKRDMRISSTHDLAEFLRCSKPEDYTRPSNTVDDLAIESGHRKMSFKFLKTTSKELLSPRKQSISVPVPVPSTIALPDKVRPEKTKKGNSYLAIQVDYTPARNENGPLNPLWTPSMSSDGNEGSVRHTTSAEFSSEGSNYRNSVISQGWKDQDSLDSYAQEDARVSMRWVRHSTGSELSSRVALLASQRRSDMPGTRISSSRYERKRVTSIPHSLVPLDMLNPGHAASPTTTAANLSQTSPTPQRRYSSDSTPRATILTNRNTRTPSNLYNDDLDTPISSPISLTSGNGSFRAKDPRTVSLESASKPARPGPPPKRGLPSLPEGHGDAMSLASKIRAAAAARSSIGSQISLASEAGSLKHRRTGTLNRTRSEREVSVKARKMKDLEEVRNRRSNNRSRAVTPEPSVAVSKKSQARSKRAVEKVNTCSFSPITVVYEVAPQTSDEADQTISENTTPRKMFSAKRRSVSSAASSEALPAQARKSLSSSYNVCATQETDAVENSSSLSMVNNVTNLETRIQNMERRNHLLEQALLAVLRGAIYKESKNEMEGPGLAEVVKCLADIPTPGTPYKF